MKELANESHEIFAQAVAFGNPPEVVYYALGYPGSARSAQEMARHPTIASRISYLQRHQHTDGQTQ